MPYPTILAGVWHLLQDAAVLSTIFPGHFIFQHDIFKSSQFNNYRVLVQNRLRNEILPEEVQFRNLVPGFMERLEDMFQSQTETLTSNNVDNIKSYFGSQL